MLKQEVDKLGKGAYIQSLTYKRPQYLKKNIILGAIDMEYSKKGLLSVQLSIEGHLSIDYLNPCKDFCIEDLRKIILTKVKEAGIPLEENQKPKTVFLASYYSTAEFSMLKNFWEDASVRNVTQKIVNISFSLKKRGEKHFRCSIIDIYHFFMDLKTKTGKKSLMDISNEFPAVKKLGGKYDLDGIGGKSKKFWIENMDKLLKQHPKEFEDYALQDVIITEALLREYRNKVWHESKVDLLQAPTNGSIATNYFRMYEMKPGEKFSNNNSISRAFILLCSHGAVMVALKRGKFENVYENDFTGFYTYSLLNSELLPRTSKDILKAATLKDLLSGYDGWAKVKFTFPKEMSGVWKNNQFIPREKGFTGKNVIKKKVSPTLPVQENYPGLKKKSLILFPRTGISYCTISEIRGAMKFGCEIEFIEGYYYKEGTNKFSDFAKKQIMLRAKAKEADDKIGEAIHKSQPNHLVGKLFQHLGGFDITNAKTIAEYLHCTIEDVVSGAFTFSIKGIEEDIAYNKEEIINLTSSKQANKKQQITAKRLENTYLEKVKKTGGKSSSEMRIGASWLPEVWSLVLGRARATIWWVVNTYGEHVTHISTDSYHDTKPLSGELKTPFGMYLIHQTTNEPKTMVIARTKLYTHGEKLASHAVHLPRSEAKQIRDLIENKNRAKYKKTGKRTLRAAIIEGEAFGSDYEKEMQYDSRWDNKMKENQDGTYTCWENINEYFNFMEKIKKK